MKNNNEFCYPVLDRIFKMRSGKEWQNINQGGLKCMNIKTEGNGLFHCYTL